MLGSQLFFTEQNRSSSTQTQTTDMDWPRSAKRTAKKSTGPPLFTPAIIPRGMLTSKTMAEQTTATLSVAGRRSIITSRQGRSYSTEVPRSPFKRFPI